MSARIRIATAGWSLPRDVSEGLPPAPSGLARYATLFDAVEVNSTFYRSHRPATLERWAAAVPEHFRFAVKLPKAITHDARLVGVDALIDRFLQETASLGDKRGPVLAQTPPKLPFDSEAVARIASRLRAGGAPSLAWEPRHESWLTPEADAWLAEHEVARVAADPAKHAMAGEPGGWRGLCYRRLHGAPRMYYSSYDNVALAALASTLDNDPAPAAWCVFDNTASSEAARNALALKTLLETTTRRA